MVSYQKFSKVREIWENCLAMIEHVWPKPGELLFTEDMEPQPVQTKLDVLSTKKHKAWPCGQWVLRPFRPWTQRQMCSKDFFWGGRYHQTSWKIMENYGKSWNIIKYHQISSIIKHQTSIYVSNSDWGQALAASTQAGKEAFWFGWFFDVAHKNRIEKKSTATVGYW